MKSSGIIAYGRNRKIEATTCPKVLATVIKLALPCPIGSVYVFVVPHHTPRTHGRAVMPHDAQCGGEELRMRMVGDSRRQLETTWRPPGNPPRLWGSQLERHQFAR